MPGRRCVRLDDDHGPVVSTKAARDDAFQVSADSLASWHDQALSSHCQPQEEQRSLPVGLLLLSAGESAVIMRKAGCCTGRAHIDGKGPPAPSPESPPLTGGEEDSVRSAACIIRAHAQGHTVNS